MRLPLSLIKSFIDFDLPSEKIGEVLTLLGIEVDKIEGADDPIFEISLTPNLGHCMSALGIARELSAALQIPLLTPKPAHFSGEKIRVHVKDSHLCPRYMCCLIEGVEVKPSPDWLKNLIEASGQKSINNVVDATNYIMLKFGQPLHAFDADLLEGEEIFVAPALAPLQFLGLDDIVREVPEGALLISDAKKPVALAGVIGGANSAISDKTKRVLLEAGQFNPLSVRSTARKVGLRTESSHRFEKGVDPKGMAIALSEAAKLIGQVQGFADLTQGPIPLKKVHYRIGRINQILGTKLSETEVEEILGRLMILAKEGVAEIPSFRQDLTEEIDLIEEVARIYGYNNIEKRVPYYPSSTTLSDPMFLFENEMRQRLVAAGLTEFLTCDLISPSLAEIAREITPSSMEFLQTTYSKSEEFSVLRTSLLPNLLQVVKGNFAQKNQTIGAFEIGRIHFLQNNEVLEIPMAAILLTGHQMPPHWSQKGTDVDFFDLKGIIESFLQGTHLPSNHLSFHPGRQADIQIEDLIVGSLGEIHPRLLEKFDIGKPVYYAELNLMHLLKKKKTHLKIAPLSQFPSSERDWTISLPLKTPIEKVFKEIQTDKSPLLEKVDLIDLYLPEGEPIKNATFRFVYRDLLKTISFEEVEKEHAKLIERILGVVQK